MSALLARLLDALLLIRRVHVVQRGALPGWWCFEHTDTTLAIVVSVVACVIFVVVFVVVVSVLWRRHSKRINQQWSDPNVSQNNVTPVSLAKARGLANGTVVDVHLDVDDALLLVCVESRDIVSVGNAGRGTANVQLSWVRASRFANPQSL